MRLSASTQAMCSTSSMLLSGMPQDLQGCLSMSKASCRVRAGALVMSWRLGPLWKPTLLLKKYTVAWPAGLTM